MRDTYDRIWTRITGSESDPTEREWALKTLKWVLHGKELFTPRGILAATAIDPERMIYDHSLEASSIEYLIRVCGNFVILDKRMDVLRFVHFSAKEFLLEKLGNSHEYLADVCLFVLGGEENDDLLEIHIYASKFWKDHARFWDEINTQRQSLIRRYLLNPHCIKVWNDFIGREGRQNVGELDETPWRTMVGFDLLAILNLPTGVGGVMEKSDLFHWCGAPCGLVDRYGNALILAARMGSVAAVASLLEAGFDVNSRGDNFGTALIAAVMARSKQIVSMLLRAGADVNCHAGPFETALLAAVFYGFPEIVSLLLEAGADVNCRRGGGVMAAVAVFYHRYIGLVGAHDPTDARVLNWEHSSMINLGYLGRSGSFADGGNRRLREGGFVLLLAITLGDEDIAALLLDAGVDTTARDVWGQTSFYQGIKKPQIAEGQRALSNVPAVEETGI